MTELKKSFFSACYLILEQNEEILLLRRFNTGYKDGLYSFIAGHIETDESVRRALVREAKEEANITVDEKDLEFALILHRNCPDDRIYHDYFFRCSSWQGELEIAEPEKCDELLWVNRNQLPENCIPYIREVIGTIYEKQSVFMEYGWNTQ